MDERTEEIMEERQPVVITNFDIYMLEREMNPRHTLGPSIVIMRDENDLWCRQYITLEGGLITQRTVQVLHRVMKFWITSGKDGDYPVDGLCIMGCDFTEPAAFWFGMNFCGLGIKYIEVLHCGTRIGDDDEEATSVGSINAAEHSHTPASVETFRMYDTNIPDTAVASIATNFIEHNMALRMLELQGTYNASTPIEMLQALWDRCDGQLDVGDRMRGIDLYYCLEDIDEAVLLRDILAHKNCSLKTLHLTPPVVAHHGCLTTTLRGLATNNGMLKNLHVRVLRWEEADWSTLASSLMENSKLQLESITTSWDTAHLSERVKAEVCDAFRNQRSLHTIDTPGIPELHFFELQENIDNWKRILFDSTKDVVARTVDCIKSWCEIHERHGFPYYSSDEETEAECLSGIYHALRSGLALNHILDAAKHPRCTEKISPPSIMEAAKRKDPPPTIPDALKDSQCSENYILPGKKRKLWHVFTSVPGLVKSGIKEAGRFFSLPTPEN